MSSSQVGGSSAGEHLGEHDQEQEHRPMLIGELATVDAQVDLVQGVVDVATEVMATSYVDVSIAIV